MAGNSSIFYLRKEINDSNIKQWQSWSYDINYVVEQFNDVVQNLTDRLDQADVTICALQEKINRLIQTSTIPPYVRLQNGLIEILSSKNQVYTKTCGLFSKGKVGQNVYIYSMKKIDGLFINGNGVSQSSFSKNENLWYASPIGQFSGSENGITFNIKSDNIEKLGDDITLVFSIHPELVTDDSTYIDENGFKKIPDGEHGISQPRDTYNKIMNDYATLTLKVKHSVIVNKPVVTLDKSALSKTLVNSTAMSTKAIAVDKQINSLTVGTYSFIKTAAEVAKNKINRKK